jgi:hypothetical protein
MRLHILFVVPAVALLAGCVSNQANKDGSIQTTAQANRSGVGGAVIAPLRDINLVRTTVPTPLLEALAEPYARPLDAGCAAIVAQVTALDEALGPDMDVKNPSKPRTQRMADQAESGAYGLMAGAAQGVIPFRGWVRKLTGAEQHDKLVGNAIAAGRVRRAYLKGLGEARGCNPPGTPAHLAETPEPITQHPEPDYPIK